MLNTRICCRHVIGQFSERQSQELCTYFIEQAVAARPESVDTVMGIFDLKGFTVFNADFSFVRFLIQAFFNYYPKMAGVKNPHPRSCLAMVHSCKINNGACGALTMGP